MKQVLLANLLSKNLLNHFNLNFQSKVRINSLLHQQIVVRLLEISERQVVRVQIASVQESFRSGMEFEAPPR